MNLCNVICSKKYDFVLSMHDSPNLSVSGVWVDGIKVYEYDYKLVTSVPKCKVTNCHESMLQFM